MNHKMSINRVTLSEKGRDVMSKLKDVKRFWSAYNHSLVNDYEAPLIGKQESEAVSRKKLQLKLRNAQIVNVSSKGRLLSYRNVDLKTYVHYGIHHQRLIKQKDELYLEEVVEERQALFKDGSLVHDQPYSHEKPKIAMDNDDIRINARKENEVPFTYDRLEAVRYAERWWNSYNPQYPIFADDCTNYVSQCLHAGGAPMRGYPNRSEGWWFRNNNWSYSWSVAHSLRWYLSGSTTGLRAQEVSDASQLQQGDVICYDFDGDGTWQHTTIVVAKDQNNMPLVNAHTTNSRMRYWAYEDSTAWTDQIAYKFFHIIDT